jgi:hypothetical protein
VVEVRRFELLTPCMPSAKDAFAGVCCRPIVAQIQGTVCADVSRRFLILSRVAYTVAYTCWSLVAARAKGQPKLVLDANNLRKLDSSCGEWKARFGTTLETVRREYFRR